MPEQLILDLPHVKAQGAEDFLVGASNQEAVDMIQCWPVWPSSSMVICGPQSVGKSHLVNMWQLRSKALIICASNLDENIAGQLDPGRPVAVEDLHNGIASEKALFYRLNMAREHNSNLLITSRQMPAELQLKLPDLNSRLRAIPVTKILFPDDLLLQNLLIKLFHDRQLHVKPEIVKYIMLHMERSAKAASQVVSEIDRLAFSTRRKVTRALVLEVIHKLFPLPY
ncbi:MAG: hypothetical protein HRT83_03265 [Hyphomicrobiaceae bacterium]|nr:hypothetical protein [Hyphomicrobiaceae bacterium]